MSVILVVETDASYAQGISEAVQPAGLPVEICDSMESAVRRAAAQPPPRLLIASSALPDVRSLLGRFARAQGGPGAVVMIPTTLVDRVSAEDYGADALLPRPFTRADVRQIVLPLLAPATPRRRQMSSADIFSDVLEEVERTKRTAEPRKPRPPSGRDIDRKLEKTLSGVLGPEASAQRPRPAADGAKEIDDLLDRTLSSLALPTRKKRKSPATAKTEEPEPAAPQPAAPQPAAPEPAAPEPTAAPEPERDDSQSETFFPELPQLDVPEPAAPQLDVPEPAAPQPAAPQPADADRFRTQRLTIVPARESTQGEIFGDYTLLRRIAVGGMAEVWQARRRGVEGFQKTVAIKKILSHLTGSPDFVTMFIDEAKLAAQLNHNNIIQIYDLGKVDEDFFIAMEYVDGMDLRTILTTARKKHRPLPMSLALTIADAVARALDYAHRKRDFDNRALGLVHRDVSPQNVLISYEGEIKLCDFGIVKAVVKASTTQMGALKGKLQYMSPEQAWGRSVDARSDIFSLGSVLFEMLTDTRPFSGDSEIGVLDAVRECRVRGPLDLMPEIPEEVDRIVLRALAKTPEERYQTAGEMEAELKAVVFNLKPMPSQSVLASYMEELANAPEPADGDDEAGGFPGWTPASGSFVDPPSEARAAAREPPAVTAEPAVAPLEPPAQAAAATGAADDGAAPQAGGSSKLWLAALFLVVLSVVLFFIFRPPGGKEGEPQPGAPQPGAPQPGAPQPGSEAVRTPVVAPEPTPPAATEATVPGLSAAGGEAAAPLDIQELVDQEMAKRAEELRKEYEQKIEQKKKELEAVAREADESGGSGDG